QEMARFAEAQLCRRKGLLAYFGDPIPEAPCEMCDRCVSSQSDIEKTDVTAEAVLFLRCMKECRERFGGGHIVSVLRGSRSQKLIEWRHDRLKSYGAGTHISAKRWRALADRFIEAGIVKSELEHGTLQITESGVGVLNGDPVFVAIEEEQIRVREEQAI